MTGLVFTHRWTGRSGVRVERLGFTRRSGVRELRFAVGWQGGECISRGYWSASMAFGVKFDQQYG
jgi:hypothetical protein